jgi:hypothetical protein
MAQRIDVDLKLSSIIPIAQSHFYNFYDVPKPTADDPPVGQFIEEEAEEDEDQDDPKKPADEKDQ